MMEASRQAISLAIQVPSFFAGGLDRRLEVVHPTFAMKLKHKFRPKADRHTFHEFQRSAWETRYQQQFPEAERLQVGERLAQHLESLFPAEDMAVLLKYGQAESREKVHIQVYNPKTERWDVYADIPMGRKVVVPAYKGTLFCGGVRWSEQADRGVSAEFQAEMWAKGEWEEWCTKQAAKDAEKVPPELEPFFARIVAERELYTQESKFDPERGMTWAEIAVRVPITGAAIQAAAQ